ncbi:MAG: hypothetical protein ABSG25_01575 [Bryobacteraceae bacterium]
MSIKLEEYWNNKDYIKFEIELKKFIGYICRRYFQGFKQSTELFDELKDRITINIYHKLFLDGYETTKIRIKILKLLQKCNKWEDFNNLYHLNLKTNKERKKFLKKINFKTYEFNVLMSELNIIDDVKTLDFRSYLFTEIRGELTKFFNKYNRERKFVDIEEVSKNLKSRCIEQKSSKEFLVLIEEIIKEYELENLLKAVDVLDYIVYSDKIPFNYVNLSYLKLISWVFVKRNFNLDNIQDIHNLNFIKLK